MQKWRIRGASGARRDAQDEGGWVASRRTGLAQRRRAAGFSQERLAETLGIDRSTVVRWEAGDTEPQPWLRPKLAATLGISQNELQMLLAEIGSQGIERGVGDPRWNLRQGDRDDMPRRELLRVFSLAGAVVAGTDLAGSLEPSQDGHEQQPASGSLEEAAAFNEHLWRTFAMSTTKRSVLPLVREHLNALITTLQRSRHAATRHRLCELVSDLFQLAGEVFFDSEHYTFAAHCYTLAAQAAREAGARDLWACALTRHAFIGVYEGEFAESVPLLDLAAGLAVRGDPALSTRFWVSAVQAEAWAGLGETTAAERALDSAEGVHSLAGTSHNGGWLRFDGSRLPEQRGTCYVLLEQPARAEAALQAASKLGISPRRRGCVLVDLASVGLQRRDIGQVVVHATAALQIAERTESGVIRRKLQRLQERLEPMRATTGLRTLENDIAEHLRARRATAES